jgi:hypothetical protein
LLSAQQGSIRTLYIKQKNDTIKLDTLTIVPGSLIITSATNLLAKKYFSLNEKKKYIIFNDSLKNDSSVLKISYKVFPFNLQQEFKNKDISAINRDQTQSKNPYIITYDKPLSSTTQFLNDGLSKNGSISRGISFGNNQDVVVNSSMNLQVSGKLNENINIVLAATDNNIPIQPDGNTQQLQEFDKVFIQLNDKQSKLTVGDFQLNRPTSYFMNFYKRAQGLMLENTTTINPLQPEKGKLTSKLSGAVSRGKFARNSFNGTENNQGPYRLKGADNELFIIVLSGTEKIYIDGKLLQRGQENDYIIDYNTSEITFTAKQLITKDKRIVAEFQYSERNYNRSLYYMGEEFENKNLQLGFHLFGEQDNKNKTFQQELSDEQKKLLSEIGDTLQQAISNGAVKADFNTTEVFYQKKDTITPNGMYTIYSYSTNPDTAYRVRFSYVGEGNGNYKQIQSSANGKVFQWVEPINGNKQGNYEALILLVTPKKKQMAIVNGNYKFENNGKLQWEGAFTNNDLNTFSDYNSNDDRGYGIKLNFDKKLFINKTDSAAKKIISTGASYELVNKNFSIIERFRSIEFNRDWNRNNDSIKNTQHIAHVQIGLDLNSKLKSNYTASTFIEQNYYKGVKHQLTTTINFKKFNLQFSPSLLTTKNDKTLINTNFYRHKSNLRKVIGKLALGYVDELEMNRFQLNNDSLLLTSYAFWEREANLSKADTSGNNFKFFYRERTDKKTSENLFKAVAYAQNIGFNSEINSFKNHQIRINLTYRQLQILDTLLIKNKPDNTLLGRLEYSPRLWKGFVQGNLFYELGFGLEQRREYSFVQVATGQGQYYWNDYNGNGIKELNEFEIALYADQASYIKIYTPSNNYIKTEHHQFSGSLNLRPSVFKKTDSGKLMSFIARWATQSIYRTDTKFIDDNKNDFFNPLLATINDTVLISSNSLFRQSVFFNQSSPIGGFDYTYQDNQIKQVVTNGPESRLNKQHELRTRINFTKSIGFFTSTTVGTKQSYAVFFTSRNYTIQSFEFEPKISYQPNTAFRASAGYKRIEKANAVEFGHQQSYTNDFLVELKMNQLSKGSFNLRMDYLIINYNGETNTPIAFEMLNSLKPGENFTWNANYQQNLNTYLQISFNYEGRKSPGTKIIHIGGAQVRAFF